MSAYVLDQEQIEKLTQVVESAITYHYYLRPETMEMFGKYSGDLHAVYRMLYITNLKAVNGRYGTDDKTFPKYRGLRPVKFDVLTPEQLRSYCRTFQCYLYQISEDPIDVTPLYYALQDVYKTLAITAVSRQNERENAAWG